MWRIHARLRNLYSLTVKPVIAVPGGTSVSRWRICPDGGGDYVVHDLHFSDEIAPPMAGGGG